MIRPIQLIFLSLTLISLPISTHAKLKELDFIPVKAELSVYINLDKVKKSAIFSYYKEIIKKRLGKSKLNNQIASLIFSKSDSFIMSTTSVGEWVISARFSEKIEVNSLIRGLEFSESEVNYHKLYSKNDRSLIFLRDRLVYGATFLILDLIQNQNAISGSKKLDFISKKINSLGDVSFIGILPEELKIKSLNSEPIYYGMNLSLKPDIAIEISLPTPGPENARYIARLVRGKINNCTETTVCQLTPFWGMLLRTKIHTLKDEVHLKTSIKANEMKAIVPLILLMFER